MESGWNTANAPVLTRASACPVGAHVPGRLASTIILVLLLVGNPALGRAQNQPDRGTAQANRSQGLLPEPAILTSLANAIDGRIGSLHDPRDGVYLRVGSLQPSAGWLKAGPGYRHHFWENRALFDVSGAVSWRTYEVVEGRVELPKVAGDHLVLGIRGLWEDVTQIGYFGAGANSALADISSYRLRSSDASVYAVIHQGRAFSFGLRAGWLARPMLSESSGWHNPGDPSTLTTFSDGTAPGLTRQPRFAHGDAAIVVDTRDHPGYPRSGTIVLVDASVYRDQDLGRYSFRRYELAAAQHVPMSNTWTLAVREGAVISETAGDQQVPFYFYPSLSSDNSLRSYVSDRFHDRDLLSLQVESRWAIFPHMDWAVFGDVGQVGPTLGTIRTSDLKTSYGVGLRFHAKTGMMGRVDLARGTEGWQIVCKLGDSLAFPAFQRWATILPIFR